MEGEGNPSYRLEDYDYVLPRQLIAQTPLRERETSRLLVLRRSSSRLGHYRFEDLPRFLKEGDVLVVNDTQVVPARLFGRKASGGNVELLILDPYKDPCLGRQEGYLCLVKSSKRCRPETKILLPWGISAVVAASEPNGMAHVLFEGIDALLPVLARIGHVPLPPYIHRENGEAAVDDAAVYQTVYAAKPGAIAAPTAGLHFSARLLEALERKGIEKVSLTLHVGYGTFSPVRTQDVREHRMHKEYVEFSSEAAERIRRAQKEGRRIVAVGTTVVRALEWVAQTRGALCHCSGFCDHYIYPGYGFKVVDALVTNFHLPRSSLLLLVSAFAGRESILHAYEEAVRERYRFFSYGDAMLIL
ncbi:MAG: tRNA preQ1(34) S-adenosylmethionine ribosyltransferase-isomerase QueA [Deltaproteobacteria bacterium]|nr:tRNA preQ1(34) S-adenosylmethionine ribosyltransferase-isomerase QueA [Deltaproteobacteria bacterium]